MTAPFTMLAIFVFRLSLVLSFVPILFAVGFLLSAGYFDEFTTIMLHLIPLLNSANISRICITSTRGQAY